MRKLILSLLLVFTLSALTSCGNDGKTAVITIIATSSNNSGVGSGISSVSYINNEGVEVNPTLNSSNEFSFTDTFVAEDGDFLFITACARVIGSTSEITVRILNNGRPIGSTTARGQDRVTETVENPPAPPSTVETQPATAPCAAVEAFADVEVDYSATGTAGTGAGTAPDVSSADDLPL